MSDEMPIHEFQNGLSAITPRKMAGCSISFAIPTEGAMGFTVHVGDLREAGERCGLLRVERLMQENGVKRLRGTRSHAP